MKNYESLGNSLQEQCQGFIWCVLLRSCSFPQRQPWLFYCVDWHRPSWSLELALLPGSMAQNLTLTSMTPTIKAAVLSIPYMLKTATLEPLKHSCKHMFLLYTVEFTAGPSWETPGRPPPEGLVLSTTLPPLRANVDTVNILIIWGLT